MDLLQGIRTRRSVRRFTGARVEDGQVLEIVSAGTWAPSGLNNQPWRFAIVRDAAVRSGIAELTKYRKTVLAADVLIAVFVDRDEMYSEVKDHQAMGACIQNMLLAAHAMGLGAVWLGEILRSEGQVRSALGLSDNLGLMAVIALGHPNEQPRAPRRLGLGKVIVKRI